MAIPLYIASLLGAAGLLILMPKQGQDDATGDHASSPSILTRLAQSGLGILLLAALPGFVWISAITAASGEAQTTSDIASNNPYNVLGQGIGSSGMLFYYVFSAISLIGAVRVITQPRPVYSALWFVMVVLSTAGLFLTLSAEFLAFAVILIYAGAILVTYMFVIMLATQAKSASVSDTDLPSYERYAREPLAATVCGFLLLAVLLTTAFSAPTKPNENAMAMSDQAMREQVLFGPAYQKQQEAQAAKAAETQSAAEANTADSASAEGTEPADLPAELPVDLVSNTERVGVDLFMSNPLGLELAGVILLMALVGAVVIAKTHVEGEDDAIARERADEAEQLASSESKSTDEQADASAESGDVAHA